MAISTYFLLSHYAYLKKRTAYLKRVGNVISSPFLIC